MFALFLELVKKVGIFIIIGQTIMHFGISKKYEKYMKLVISFMVAAQVIFAFGVYFKQDDNSRQMMSQEEYLKKWDASMKEVEERMERSREEMALKLEGEYYQSGAKVIHNTEDNHDIKVEKIMIP